MIIYLRPGVAEKDCFPAEDDCPQVPTTVTETEQDKSVI